MIVVQDITKIYRVGEFTVPALNGVSLTITRGESVAVMGPSGSGKSTFMNILGCLDQPSAGSYLLDGVDVGGFSKDELAAIRNRKMGFVFQGFNLLPRASAQENVELPMLYSGVPAGERRRRSREALTKLGLEGREHHLPNQLSGGQQQRVAIARALVNEAPLLFADEPTGNLDTKTSLEIMDLLTRLNREGGITLVVVTHELDIAAFCSRVIRFVDGVVVSDVRRETGV
ncbi:MAG TPA: ABC transporter ATP-binding protein [Syntrophales bacterium]|jgi:putative ABC transport system ATP-binding protein|nr:ABC transporter ATP-binding protein [Syntrophales bacterium]HON22438.1 ABC transporter ATP-binding protein [Syntrophales bacterium]HOU78003.1 ABC transporter ATP-binding protein [Syntrophales bacterium]HPC32200.1 ABC transporter ATP-binding protein [Syntrophales bacterium]HQG33898.1 ABC transporter ATP-binding protein [Syntrophales bacterium]